MDNLFSSQILTWYRNNKRELPWRDTSDPYKIWLSEIILQQTRVAQGLPYYESFIASFPNISALAQADEQLVLRQWQGLGYYSRARNLHKCAKIIVSEHSGKFPSDYHSLLKLPGIGTYTAAAISSFAFDKPHAVLDGNVFRVLSRYFCWEDDIASPAGKKNFTVLANSTLPPENHADYNQGIMEFGALQCIPKNPDCQICPLAGTCLGYRKKKTDVLPIKSKKPKVTKRHFTYLVVRHSNKIWMKQRKEKIWQGLFEFLLYEEDELDSIKNLNQLKPIAEYRHQLSHLDIHAKFLLADRSELDSSLLQDGDFYLIDEIELLPKSILIEKFIQNNYESLIP